MGEQPASEVLLLESMSDRVPISPLWRAFYTDMFAAILDFAQIRIISSTFPLLSGDEETKALQKRSKIFIHINTDPIGRNDLYEEIK